MMLRKREVNSGFTLVEIVFVVLIIGLLMSVVGFSIPKVMNRVHANTTKANLKTLKSAIDIFHADNGSYPTHLEDLVDRPKGDYPNWHSILDKIPHDAWGYEFEYKITPGKKYPYELYSYGSSEGPNGPEENIINAWS